MSVTAYVPGIAQFVGYDKRWLGKDIVAGLVLSALLVPQGMAYAELAGLPAVTGLYTSICAWSATRSSVLLGSWSWDLIHPWGR